MEVVAMLTKLLTFLFLIQSGNCYYMDDVLKALQESGAEYDERCLKLLKCGDVKQEWELFREIYPKSYKNETVEEERRHIFEAASEKIHKSQKNFAAGKTKFVLGLNKFSDLSPEEFQTKQLTVGNVETQNYSVSRGQEVIGPINRNAKYLDLRVSEIPVKDQADCGSCWAFAAVGVLEYNLFWMYEKYIPLSEQRTMDCARKNGCNGGWPQDVYDYYKKRGVSLQEDFPYTAVNAKCSSYRTPFKKPKPAKYSPKNGPETWCILHPNNEETLKEALHRWGWISICVNANKWQFYLGGIMTDDGTDPGFINHAVILVGYGVDKRTNTPYWIIRNSWGPDWGEGGYIRIERGKGAFQIVSYPKGSCYVQIEKDDC